MKIMKLLASCAIIGALASTTVMAAESDFLGEYNATDNSIAINLTAADVTKYCESVTGDLTILVTNVDAAGTITNTNIFQIDQGTVATLDNDGDDNTTTAVLKLSEAVATDYAVENRETDSVYYVRIGGGTVEVENTDGTKSNVAGYIYDTFKFAVPEVEEPEKPETIGRYVGDFIFDEDINPEDANGIMKYNAGMAVYEDGSEPEYVDLFASAYAADESVNPIDDLSGDDANAIMWWVAGNTDVDKAGNVAGYGEFYYDEENDMYLLYGDLIFE